MRQKVDSGGAILQDKHLPPELVDENFQVLGEEFRAKIQAIGSPEQFEEWQQLTPAHQPVPLSMSRLHP
jgi:hypothetical protein